MAGATTPQQQSCAALEKAIREAGREPMQRDTWYRRIAPTWQKPRRHRGTGRRVRSLSGARAACGSAACSISTRSRSSTATTGRSSSIIPPASRATSSPASSMWRSCRPSRRCAIRATLLADGVAIASDGPVYSVFLAHRGPLAEVRTHRARSGVAHFGASAAGAARASFTACARSCWNCPLSRRRPTPCCSSAIRPSTSASAIAARIRFLDLGEEWKRCTGLPFVFAPWLLRARPAERRRSRRRSPRAEAARPRAPRRDRPRRAARSRVHPRATSPSTSASTSASARKQGIEKFRELLAKHGFIPDPASHCATSEAPVLSRGSTPRRASPKVPRREQPEVHHPDQQGPHPRQPRAAGRDVLQRHRRARPPLRRLHVPLAAAPRASHYLHHLLGRVRMGHPARRPARALRHGESARRREARAAPDRAGVERKAADRNPPDPNAP